MAPHADAAATDDMAPTVRRRTLGREAALAWLYQWDLRGELPDDWREQLAWSAERQPEAARFARALVEEVMARRAALDAAIAAVAANWTVERMAVIDRNVLRLGALEILHRAECPPAVVINEAIELAKKYSTEASGAFVNGILDALAPNPDAADPAAPPPPAPAAGAATPAGTSPLSLPA